MDEKRLADFLKTLLRAPGLSSHEDPVRELIRAEWEPLAARVEVTRLGSLHAYKPGGAPAPRPKILLAAHMDAIGLMITQVTGGFCRFTEIGGVDPRILPGMAVTIHGRADLPAEVVFPPAALLPPDRKAKAARHHDLWLDTGLPAAEAERLIRTGDLVSFEQEPILLKEDILTGKALDNRASVAAITVCLHELQRKSHRPDVVFAATVQEEETLGGAKTSAFRERPQLAIAVDVTWANGPGLAEEKTFPLGEGPTICWGPNIHPAVFHALEKSAKRADIPYHFEPVPQHSGTDTYAMQVVAEGIPTAVLGIPLRYMHTPVETVSLADIRRTGRLLAEFLAAADDAFFAGMIWE